MSGVIPIEPLSRSPRRLPTARSAPVHFARGADRRAHDVRRLRHPRTPSRKMAMAFLECGATWAEAYAPPRRAPGDVRRFPAPTCRRNRILQAAVLRVGGGGGAGSAPVPRTVPRLGHVRVRLHPHGDGKFRGPPRTSSTRRRSRRNCSRACCGPSAARLYGLSR